LRAGKAYQPAIPDSWGFSHEVLNQKYINFYWAYKDRQFALAESASARYDRSVQWTSSIPGEKSMHALATALALHAACLGVGEIFSYLCYRDPFLDMPAVHACCKTDSTVFYGAMLPKKYTQCEPVLGRLVATDYCDPVFSWYEAPDYPDSAVRFFRTQRMFANYYWYGRLGIPHFLTQEGARAMYGLDQSAELEPNRFLADGSTGI
jgi:hypothetical protein